jgi:hypothetical protein
MFSGAAIGYLDSRNSDSFEIIKSPVGYEFSEKISISRDERTEHIRRFRAALSAIGLLPIRMLIRFAKPGEGYHFGSINELVVDPTTKLLGKTKRIYVMDASSSSRISAGPVTYPVMADIRRSLQKQQKMDEL